MARRSRIHFLLSPRNTGSHRSVQNAGRSPSVRRCRGSDKTHLLSAGIKKQEGPDVAILLLSSIQNFLRRHYPHQVIGSKVIPSSQPVSTSSPVFRWYGIKKETSVRCLRKPCSRKFLRRHYPHQVSGSKVGPSSQPVSTSSPLLFSFPVLYCNDLPIARKIRIPKNADLIKFSSY